MCLYTNGQTGLFQRVWVNSDLFSRKMPRVALFFTCYDEFDVLGWLPCKNIQECVRLLANGSNLAVSERLGEFSALSRKRLGSRSFSLLTMSLMC